MALTRKRRLFVVYYLTKAKANATLAARLAGFRSPEMAGPRLIRNDEIRAAIDLKLDLVAMDVEEVLARLTALAATDAADFLKFSRDRSPDSLPTLDLRKARRRDQLISVREITAQQIGDSAALVVKVKLHDAHKALALLAKYHGILDARGDPAPETDPADKAPRIKIADRKALPPPDDVKEPGG